MPHAIADLFDAPADLGAAIWRYMDFPKFVAMLESRSLYLARADKLPDPFEGSVTQELVARRAEPSSTWLAKIFGIYVAERYQGARGYMFMNCWSLSDGESAALWPLYVSSNQGVAIRSTYIRLVEAICLEDRPIFIGCVRYIDYVKDTFPSRGPEDEPVQAPFIHKRKSFEHESELRVLWWDGESLNTNMGGHIAGEAMPAKFMEGAHPSGVSASVDLVKLIDVVRISPDAPIWFKDLVEAVVKRYGFAFDITKSDLAVDPVF